MKCELENIKPQQYPRQKSTDMSVDVTYHCQALTTSGIWDHQLCLSILSTFLHTNSNEMYCHSLITMKTTLRDELKKVKSMEHAGGTTFAAKDLPMPTFETSLKLSTMKPRVWVSALLPHMPRNPRHHILPSARPKSTPFSSTFNRTSPPLSCKTRATTLPTIVVRKDIGPMNVQTRLALQWSLALTLSSPMDILWYLQDVLDTEIHASTADTTKKDDKQTNKVGNIFL